MSTKQSNATNTTELVDIKLPDFYRVIIHNDDTTPIDFVLFILIECTELPETVAFEKAQEAHLSGSSVIGIYTETQAAFIVEMCTKTASLNGYEDFTVTKEKENE